jgi:hypothetical protein
MSEVVLHGLSGDSPIGFLAAVGAHRLLGSRLRWVEAGPRWVAALDHPDPVAALLAARADRSTWPAGRDLSSLTVDAWLALADREPQWATALACQDGDGLARSAFDLGKASLLRNLRELPARVTAAHLDRALFGPWKYEPGQYMCGLDPQAVVVAATTHALPTSQKRKGLPGALWLALEALPCFPVFMTERGARTTGWQGDDFLWPIWAPFLSGAALRALLARPVERPGVIALFRSRKVRIAKTIQAFAPATRIPASNSAVHKTLASLASGQTAANQRVGGESSGGPRGA